MGYPGIADRMQKEITALAPSTILDVVLKESNIRICKATKSTSEFHGFDTLKVTHLLHDLLVKGLGSLLGCFDFCRQATDLHLEFPLTLTPALLVIHTTHVFYLL